YKAAAAFADLHFVGVGTPQKPGEYAADLRQLHAVIEHLVPHLSQSAVIVGKSTVPVGTAEAIAAKLRALSPVGEDIEVAWNPEFLREGFAVQDTLKPDRLVFGIERDRVGRAEAMLREIYEPLISAEIPLVVTDLAT